MARKPSPDDLPEDVLEVNGFRHVRSHEYYVEWRDVSTGKTVNIWIEFESTPHTGSGWNVQYEVQPRGGGRYLDHGTIGTYGPKEFEDALAAAVSWMRSKGTGKEDLAGDFNFT